MIDDWICFSYYVEPICTLCCHSVIENSHKFGTNFFLTCIRCLTLCKKNCEEISKYTNYNNDMIGYFHM